jgi:hypothetical protein
MKVCFRYLALVSALQIVAASSIYAQQAERVRLSDATPAIVQVADETPLISPIPGPTLSAGPTLPAAAFAIAHEAPLVVEATPTDAGPVELTSSITVSDAKPEGFKLLPLQSFLGVKKVPVLSPLQPIEPQGNVVVASSPLIGPPQLPTIAKMAALAGPGTNIANDSLIAPQDPPPAEATPDAPQNAAASKEIKLESIIGGLSSQESIFSKLKIDRAEVLATAPVAPPQRLEYLPDGSLAAWQGDVYCWTAPGFFHNPLYFEQVNLERYGQGTYSHLQTAASGAHFFATIPILPYKIGGQEWCERVHTLGHRRPGNCNPHQVHYHPFSWKGVTYQAAATAGIVFIVP